MCLWTIKLALAPLISEMSSNFVFDCGFGPLISEMSSNFVVDCGFGPMISEMSSHVHNICAVLSEL